MRFPQFENAVVQADQSVWQIGPCLASHRFEVESLRSRPRVGPSIGARKSQALAPRADQNAARLVRIAAGHMEHVATIEHGRRRYAEGVAGAVVRPL